jgi:hypothetical protein
MNRDDVLLAMKKVGAAKHDLMPKTYEGVVEVFERFASLATAIEREACAKTAEQWGRDIRVETWDMAGKDCAAAIRARSKE